MGKKAAANAGFLILAAVLLIFIFFNHSFNKSPVGLDQLENRIATLQKDITTAKQDQAKLQEDIDNLRTSNSLAIEVNADLDERLKVVEGRKRNVYE